MGIKLNKNKLLAILLIAALGFFIYYAITFSVELAYFIIYKFRERPYLNATFSINLWIYYTYILPYILAFTNLCLALVEKKTINRIAVFIVYAVFIFGDWGLLLRLEWPYRTIPVLCVLTFFYILDILTARFIVKKLLHKDIL
jgi:hypothetical protein